MFRLFTLGLFVLLSTIIQPVLPLPVQGPSLFRRTLAHHMTPQEYPGHNHVHGKDTYAAIVHHTAAQTPAQTEGRARNAYHQARYHAVSHGHNQNDAFIVAALHVPPDANHPEHTTYIGSIPKGAGHAHYQAHPEEVRPGAGNHNWMHAETHALALAHADGRKPGPGSYMAVYGKFAGDGLGKLPPCDNHGANSCQNVLQNHQIGFGQR